MAKSKDATAEIKAVNKAIGAAVAKGDAAACAASYTRTGQVLLPGGPAIRGRKAIAQWWQAGIGGGIQGVTLTAKEVETHGTTAIEVGAYKITGPGRQVLDTGKYIVVWKKEDGQWKLHRDIFNTSVAAAPAPAA